MRIVPGVALLLLLCSAHSVSAADADLKITVTNGSDTQGSANVQVRPAGQHNGDVVAGGRSGDDIKLPAGTYDVEVSYSDGAANKTVWFDSMALTGHIEKKMDMGVAVADLKITATNGSDTQGGPAHIDVRPAGQHNGDVIVGGRSGDELRLAAGTYDVEVSYNDGNANKVIWFDRLALSGRIEKKLDMGLNVASLRVVVTNGGADVGDKGMFEIRPQGNHNADVIAGGRSGETARVEAGKYDVDVRFQDGAVNKMLWLDGLVLSGAVNKTVEVGASLADVTWHIVSHGADLGIDAAYEFRPDGNHNGDVIAGGHSGDSVRLSAGTYVIGVGYAKGLINKKVWLDHQAISGKVERTTDLALNIAQPTVTATLNGADVGNKARIGIFLPGQSDEIGNIQSGDKPTLEAGRYTWTATMPGAEGTLSNVAVAGAPHLVVAMKTLQTAELKDGGPPPKACTIEVYGVNFDFNKSVLRPDSAPVLLEIATLFTSAPSFRAEVGGHTDNIGKEDYNMKLSEARAAAVKTWLVAHGVATERVTSRGYGDTRPLVANDTDANRFKNRRVELRRMNCQ